MATKREIRELYQQRAKHYDITANLYYLIGFREQAYRKMAVDALDLRRGDTVIEVCCGTGLNFPLLQQKVGQEGRIIGVDISDAMLEGAARRVARQRWKNVELIRQDAGTYTFPGRIDGAISTFALTFLPEYETVIRRAHYSLDAGKKFSLLDFKLPDSPLRYLAPLGVLITRPFGIEMELAERHPWESIARHFRNMSMKDIYGGFAYLAVGKK